MEKITLICDKDGIRADSFLAERVEQLTRSSAALLIDKGNLILKDKAIRKNQKLKIGDTLTLTLPDPEPIEATAENIPIDIAFEDKWLLVVNKPKGMVVHPANGNPNHTLVNALLYHCEGSLSGINGKMRPGIVHRIDKDTSGLLMVAKNDISHNNLAEQIKEHSFLREYEAVVLGNIKEDNGTIDRPIGRNPNDRKKMAVTTKNAKNAVTHFEVIKRYHGFTHIKCRLETGRTHQIRVHLSSIGHPVAGDTVYGGAKNTHGLQGQCLHAKVIGFNHPENGEFIKIDSELPQYFTDFLSKLREAE